MNIVIQGVEICGIVADLASEMTAQGHNVTTIVDPNRFFHKRYDYRLTNCLHDYSARLPLPLEIGSRFAQGLSYFSKPAYRRLSMHVRHRICLEADLYIQVWSGWPGEYQLLRQLRTKGTKIVTLMLGSDVRHYPCFQQQYGEEDWPFPKEHLTGILPKLKRLRMHERYADAIFSVPDQMGLAVRPYHHLTVPIDCGSIEFNLPDRARPLVLHAPTNEAIKGSRVIEGALAQLKCEGFRFDYLPLKGVPHETVLKALSVADVLIDELLLHGPLVGL